MMRTTTIIVILFSLVALTGCQTVTRYEMDTMHLATVDLPEAEYHFTFTQQVASLTVHSVSDYIIQQHGHDLVIRQVTEEL